MTATVYSIRVTEEQAQAILTALSHDTQDHPTAARIREQIDRTDGRHAAQDAATSRRYVDYVAGTPYAITDEEADK